ncbi:MAG TPA: hypothetical protein VGK78_12120 [Nocardioides sp.]|uniref:hypothetical protein n=1 Tax=Nocardioides sp. TaxID=35761 RepID=UPI002F41B790
MIRRPAVGCGQKIAWCASAATAHARVREFSIPELAVAREVSATACERDLADVLDLIHRLPKVWALTRELACPVWLSRKVARLSRKLSAEQAEIVDAAVAEAIAAEAPGRVLEICEAKVIEADPAAHASRVEAQRRRRYVGLSRTDEYGLRHLIARMNAGDAVWIDAMVERVAGLIADQHLKPAGTSCARSRWAGWPAPPRFSSCSLEGQAKDRGNDVEISRATAFPADLLDALATAEPERFRPRVDLYVHLSALTLTGLTPPVARVEGVGPLLVDSQLFTGCRVRATPVIDLNDRRAQGHGTRPYVYDADGPPGQTGTHNSGPLGRRHHRWKTHAGFTSRQCGGNRYVWRTPHGRYYLVDHRGTHRLDPEQGAMMFDAPPGVDLYFADLTYDPA